LLPKFSGWQIFPDSWKIFFPEKFPDRIFRIFSGRELVYKYSGCVPEIFCEGINRNISDIPDRCFVCGRAEGRARPQVLAMIES